MDNRKFLGVCVLLASLILGFAIIWHALTLSQIGRYQLINESSEQTIYFHVIDTTTGEIFAITDATQISNERRKNLSKHSE